jgi:hypothetical protein
VTGVPEVLDAEERLAGMLADNRVLAPPPFPLLWVHTDLVIHCL